MIKSMTGYGKGLMENDHLSLEIEIKSLNSKFLDLSLRMPKELNLREMELRKIIGQKLVRGKVSLSIELARKSGSRIKMSYDEDLFRAYYDQLQALANKVGANGEEIFKMAIQSPEVSTSNLEEGVAQEDWETVLAVLDEALDQCDRFRTQEGEVLSNHLKDYLSNIAGLLNQVESEEPGRVEAIRARISQSLSELQSKMGLDPNRMEQELIYYLERLDISEEIDRLRSHIKHFEETLEHGLLQGKKLGFISQEMGREINTIGSKANQAIIQQLVVAMKDELEKIKEQLFNIL